MVLKLYRSIAARFKSFSNKQEMNEHIAAHIFRAGKKLRGNYRTVLDTIAQHSCVITGVAWIGEDTIAKSLGICEKTVKRAIDRLQLLGIIRREIANVDGMVFRYLVINRFELSEELSAELSKQEEAFSLTAPTDEITFSEDEPIESREIKDRYVVESSASSVILFPSSITQLLSQNKLSVNIATMRRWLSLASEETIVQVIQYALTRNVHSVIGYITAILIQGWTSPSATVKKFIPKKHTAQRQPAHRDILPEWIVRQHERSNVSNTSNEGLTEEQQRQADELLRALGEIE